MTLKRIFTATVLILLALTVSGVCFWISFILAGTKMLLFFPFCLLFGLSGCLVFTIAVIFVFTEDVSGETGYALDATYEIATKIFRK